MGVGAARAEEVGAFAGIVAIAFGVDDVVDAVEEEAQGEDDVEQAEPEGAVVDLERAAERHEVEENGGGPETGAGNLEKKRKVGTETEFWEALWRGGQGRNLTQRTRRRVETT